MADENDFPETISLRMNDEDRSKLVAAANILEKANEGVSMTASAILRAALYFFVARKEAEKSAKPTKK